ncbi:MAG: hypothetical protein WCS72_14535 [Deltaproteobacteria bacterium]
MRRTFLIVILALGTVGGFASGIAHHHAWRHGGHARSGCEHGHRPQGSPPPAAP